MSFAGLDAVAIANDCLISSISSDTFNPMMNVQSCVKQGICHLLEGTVPGYRFLLRRDHNVRGPACRPRAPSYNAVLQTRRERDEAINQITSLGLPLHLDAPKNWDSLTALDCILSNTSRGARVLDAGAEMYSCILQWLRLYGFRRLEGINVVFKGETRRGPITYKYGDITHTEYGAATFDAITCLSVIEHGVDLDAYFREMSRILKPGGILITSTDYWQAPIDTKGQEMYGVPIRVFTQQEVRHAIELARRSGLVLATPINLISSEKVVHWEEVGLDFTFVVFTLRKSTAVRINLERRQSPRS